MAGGQRLVTRALEKFDRREDPGDDRDLSQSRTQSPQAPWSAVWSPGETLGKWNFFP